LADPDQLHDADEPRPWERPGAVRRDVQPHRGPPLRLLGSLALNYGVGALVLPCLAGVPWGLLVFVPLWLGGLGLAVAVLVVARRDLALMEAGKMDPEGRPATAVARDRARWAASLWLQVLMAGAIVVACRWR
jgi:hypothetical protein